MPLLSTRNEPDLAGDYLEWPTIPSRLLAEVQESREDTAMKAVVFRCPDCLDEEGNGRVVHVISAILEDDEVRFIGQCPDCKTALRFPLDQILVSLVDKVLSRPEGNGRVH